MIKKTTFYIFQVSHASREVVLNPAELNGEAEIRFEVEK